MPHIVFLVVPPFFLEYIYIIINPWTGHVLCASCCTAIVEQKKSLRVCPFCRERFSSGDARLICIDFSSSGWSDLRREANRNDFPSDVLPSKIERPLPYEGSSKTREARRLEDKVARAATRICTVEEVSSLHKELQEWLMAEAQEDQVLYIFFSPLIQCDRTWYTHCWCLDLVSLPVCSSSASHSHEPYFPRGGHQIGTGQRSQPEKQGR